VLDDDGLIFRACKPARTGICSKRSKPAELRGALFGRAERRCADEQRHCAAGGAFVPASAGQSPQ